MRELSGPTWRRLKACLEYKFREIPVPTTGHDDRVKTVGLLLGLSRGEERVLKDERLQLKLGSEDAPEAGEDALQARVHALAQTAPIENYIR